MQQFDLRTNKLYLKVRKTPLIIRAIFFALAFSFFILPIISLALSTSNGDGLKFGHFIFVGVFGLMGFYLLRISLWNTYGNETIEISANKIIYEADYGWFKDGRKEITNIELIYSIKSIGYEEENKGVLVIGSNETKIESVVKIPIPQLEELIKKLKEL